MKRLLPFKCLALFTLLANSALGQTKVPATLEFIENKGQWDAQARFVAALPSGRLFAEADGLTFSLLNAPDLAHHGQPAGAEKAPHSPADSPIQGHAVKLRFVGAAPTAQLLAAEATPDRRNYFLGADPKHWAQDVRGFRRLRYANLWPGVSAQVYESADQQLEYDFELAAGADPAIIALRHDGAEAVQLDVAGNLQIQTSVGRITEQAPQAWQTTAAGRRQPVTCRYQLAADGTVRFALGTYDPQRPLTIDPVVLFSTYTGSLADNWGFTATYDAQGNLYSAGIAFAIGFPASPGAFSTTFAGITDIAIIKYNIGVSGPAARVWATYLGGASSDFPASLVVNSQGELLMLGVTSSSNYPTTVGAVQRAFGGGLPGDPYGSGRPTLLPNGSDLVITRFNATGSALVGSTYLGGSSNDGVLPLNPNTAAQLAHNYGDPFRGDILVDAADNVYVASHTGSPDFPLSQGFNNTYRGGDTDGLVLKLNPSLTALLWGSFLGGTASDATYSIQVEPASGDLYVAGGTLSANFPTTAGSYQPTWSGDVDGFAARIAANGRSLTQATYLGTSSYDQAYFLQLGSDGGVYVLGQTVGTYPTTPGLYTTPNGGHFIHKLNADLSATQLATVFGTGNNSIDLNPTAFLVDRCDRVYVCGWGGSSNQASFGNPVYLSLNGNTTGLPVTPNAMQATTDGNDFYLVQFAAGLTRLDYATFFGQVGSGGDHVDGGTARFDPRGVVYQAVCSCGTRAGFPIPGGVNTFSTTNNSTNCNNAAFVLDFQPNIAYAGTDQAVCATAGPQPLVGFPAGGVWSGPGVTGSVGAGFVFTPSLALLGIQTLTYTVASTGLCTTVDTRRMTVSSPVPVTFAPVGTGIFCRAATGTTLPPVPLVGSPAGGTFSGPGVTGNMFDPMQSGPGTHLLTYTYTNGCVVTATQQVRVVFVSAGGGYQLCAPGPPMVLSGSPTGGTWTGPGVTGSLATGFVFTPATSLIGNNVLTYAVTTTAPGNPAQCSATSTTTFTVTPTPVVSLTPLPLLCVANNTRQPLLGSPAGGGWTGPGVGFDGLNYYFQPPGVAGTYQLTYAVNNGLCPATAELSVVVSSFLAVAVPADTVLCPGSTQAFRLRASLAGGTWAGPGVTGSPEAGYLFAPAGLAGTASLVYTVVNGGCTDTGTRRVTVAPIPDGVPTWAPEACPETRLAPLTLRFRLPPSRVVSYTSLVWEFGDGSQSVDDSPVHTYAQPGTYHPRVRIRYNQDRCETQVPLPPVEVQERKVPNIITPNGDQLNENFRLGPDCPPRLQVFSRWGKQVFEAAAYHDEWKADGLATGVYYYLLTYPDGHRVKGWVEVAR